MTKGSYWLIIISTLMIVACVEDDTSDLNEFINDSGKNLQGHVETIPEVKDYEHFAYEAFDLPSPFAPRETDRENKSDNGIRPDFDRPKEVLEGFPLESIKMVGSLQQDNIIVGLIRTPDNALHRVTIGNYLGQDYGKVFAVLESEIEFKEKVSDSEDEWIERNRKLILED